MDNLDGLLDQLIEAQKHHRDLALATFRRFGGDQFAGGDLQGGGGGMMSDQSSAVLRLPAAQEFIGRSRRTLNYWRRRGWLNFACDPVDRRHKVVNTNELLRAKAMSEESKREHGRRLAEQARKHGWTPPGGESHHAARLTNSDVEIIRNLRLAGMSLKELSSQFGVGVSMISQICTGRKWKHLLNADRKGSA